LAKEFAKSFYNSSAWKRCRASYVETKQGLCERCREPGNIVHHIEYLTPYNINNPDVTLNHENLELLCATCHQHEHYLRNSPTVEGVMFDEQGNLIKRDAPHSEIKNKPAGDREEGFKKYTGHFA